MSPWKIPRNSTTCRKNMLQLNYNHSDKVPIENRAEYTLKFKFSGEPRENAPIRQIEIESLTFSFCSTPYTDEKLSTKSQDSKFLALTTKNAFGNTYTFTILCHIPVFYDNDHTLSGLHFHNAKATIDLHVSYINLLDVKTKTVHKLSLAFANEKVFSVEEKIEFKKM